MDLPRNLPFSILDIVVIRKKNKYIISGKRAICEIYTTMPIARGFLSRQQSCVKQAGIMTILTT